MTGEVELLTYFSDCYLQQLQLLRKSPVFLCIVSATASTPLLPTRRCDKEELPSGEVASTQEMTSDSCTIHLQCAHFIIC